MKKERARRAVVAHTFNLSTWETEADRSLLSLRPAWSTEFQDTHSNCTEKPCLEKQNKMKNRARRTKKAPKSKEGSLRTKKDEEWLSWEP